MTATIGDEPEVAPHAPEPNRRKPISKHLRFQILRRDNHTCRYCGAKAPDVPIKVDHVTPVVLGGTNDPSNLVASCEPCNAGKSAIPPDAPLVADVAQDALRWATARETAAARLRMADDERDGKCIEVVEHWCQFYRDFTGRIPPNDEIDGLKSSVYVWLDRGLSPADMCRLIDTAVRPRAGKLRRGALVQYFAGCCWTRLRQIDQIAQELVAEEAEAAQDGEWLAKFDNIAWLTDILNEFCESLPGWRSLPPLNETDRDLLNRDETLLIALIKIADVLVCDLDRTETTITGEVCP